MNKVYVAIGANLGNPIAAMRSALSALHQHPALSGLRCSSIYRTSPVSPIPQPYFLNAVCQFHTDLSPYALLNELQLIQLQHGQLPKVSYMLPRYLDLDLLFFGFQAMASSTLQIPHPRWQERLFVLIPLRDLVDRIILPNGQIVQLDVMIGALQKLNNEEVSLYET